MKREYGQTRLSRRDIYLDLKKVFTKYDTSKVFVMTDMNYEKSYLAKYFNELGLDVTLHTGKCDGTYKTACDLTEEFRASGSTLIVAAGSGSVIRAAKAVKLFSKLDPSEDYLAQVEEEVKQREQEKAKREQEKRERWEEKYFQAAVSPDAFTLAPADEEVHSEPEPHEEDEDDHEHEDESVVSHTRPDGTAPLIAVPTTIEDGSEGNGLVMLEVAGSDAAPAGAEEASGVSAPEGRTVMLSEKSARPDYVLLDRRLIASESPEARNEGIAGAIGQALFIIWSCKETSRAGEMAREGIAIVLDHMMEYLRDETSCYSEMQNGAYLIGRAAGYAGVLSIYRLADAVAHLAGVSFQRASMMLQAPLALVMENRIVAQEIRTLNTEKLLLDDIDVEELFSEEDLPLFDKIKSVTDVIAFGSYKVNILHRQISFVEQLLALDLPEYCGDDAAKAFAADLPVDVFGEWPIEYTREEILFLTLQLFHRVQVWYFLELCARRPNRRAAILEETQLKYEDDFSDERIIEDPFYLRRVERNKFVRGLQALTLETLVLTRDFLQENGLRFYLSEGTLLGAVRHKGFIPWDDDVDIMMPREDYDALVQLAAEGKVPPELNFDALENNPKHWVLGAKMQLTRPTNYIQHKVTNLSKYNGPYVDIFPLDYWNRPHTKKHYRAQRKVKMCRRLLFMKTGYSKKTKKKFHRILMRIAVPFIPQRLISWYAVRNMKKFFNGKRKYYVHLCSYYPYYKEVFPVGMFGEPLMLPFEGYEMPVPQEYDYMLRTIYGNSYDKIPPQKVTKMRRHAFELVDNGQDEDEEL